MSSRVVKYYIYLSGTKADMLYSQLPPEFLRGADAEVKVNLGVIATTLKARGPEESKELPARVGTIASYLRDHHEVGTILNPKSWIEGTLVMRWGCVREDAADIAFFGGGFGATTVALLGSSESMIGAPKTAEANHAPFYYTMRFLNSIIENRRFTISSGDESQKGEAASLSSSYAQTATIAHNALAGSEANLEFLAMVLHNAENLIVATPLYVALAT